MAGTSRAIGHLYDADGNRVRITHPDGGWLAYEYDGLGRFKLLRENSGDALVTLTYDSAGRRSGLTSGGTASGYAYDAAGRLQSLTHNLSGTNADQVIGLGYNPASQIATRSGTNDSYAWRGAVSVSRDYARNGQNQYTGTISNGEPSATFGYDMNGNLISDGSSAFAYDVENRLVAASGAKTAALIYDPLGRLFQTSGGAAGVTQFLYDDDALIGEYNTAGTMLRRYVHGSEKGVDDPLLWYENLASGWRRALVADQQGSIIAVADMYGTPIAINAYDEYGIPGANNQGRFQYTGQAWLPELGMYYYKARMYSPTLGRFLQVDLIGYEDQFNLYAYVANDPTNRTDPTGRDAIINVTNGNQVHIILPVTYGGASDSPMARANFERNFVNAYQGEKGVYNVTVEVRAPLASDPISSNSVNFENLGPNTPSTVAGGRNATINLDSPGISQGTEAHEGGHLLGNPDRYTDNGLTGAARVTTANPGFEGNIMGALGPKQTTDQRDITGAITAPNNDVTYRNERVPPF